MAAAILTPLHDKLRPIAETMVPPIADLDDAAFLKVLALIDVRLAGEPPALGRQLRLFVKVLTFLPIFFALRTFGGLAPKRRLAFLEALQDCPIQKLRVGVWGLRTLIYLGYYTDPNVQAALGYRPRLDGWEGLAREKAQQAHEVHP